MKIVEAIKSFPACSIGQWVPPLDGGGIYGSVMQYTLFFTLMGSALIAFIYFWIKGKLDMDESPKMQMMNDEDKKHESKNN